MKIIKILIINFFIFLILFLICDFLFALKIHNKHVEFFNSLWKNQERPEETVPILKCWFNESIPFEKIWNRDYRDSYRLYKVENPTKSSILVFGCSFAFGAFLNHYQTFEYYLSKETNRTVFNYGFGGMGPQNLLYQVSNPKLYEYINEIEKTPPEYAIYIYIPSHALRIYSNKYLAYQNPTQLGYDQRNGRLVKSNSFFLFISRFSIIKFFIMKYLGKTALQNDNYMSSLLKKYFIQSRDELQKRYPNIKFIIIKHPCSKEEKSNNEYYYDCWKQLENEGVIIYDLIEKIDFDVTDSEYMFPDTHPNEKLWKEITPIIIKDLKL